jgi:hypothetical protein
MIRRSGLLDDLSARLKEEGENDVTVDDILRERAYEKTRLERQLV